MPLTPSISRDASATGPPAAATSDELYRLLSNGTAFDKPPELVVFSSLTTLRGFSSALRIYLIKGRLLGFGLRHDLATIAMAHTSSRRSSSIMSEGSTILVTSSLSLILMYGSVISKNSFTVDSFDELMPSLPVTSSRRTFPKQYTSYAHVALGVPLHYSELNVLTTAV